MAMRVHVLAARVAEPDRVRRRLDVEVWALGDWTCGLASVWSVGQQQASWRLALVSRERGCLAYRATTVDDAFVDFEAFWKGEPVAHLVHHYGGLLGSTGGQADGDGAIDWDQPLTAAQAGELGEDEGWDEEVVALASEGRTLREATRQVASRRAEQLASVLTQGEAAAFRAQIESVLLGRPSDPQADAEDDPLSMWADVPDLLEAAGLTGFREALRARMGAGDGAEAEQAAEAVEAQEAEAAREAAQRRGKTTRMLGCTFVLAISVVGAVVGFRDGGMLGAVGGLATGGFVFAGLVGYRLWRSTRGLRKLLWAGKGGPSSPAPRMTGEAKRLLASWRMVGARMGEAVPGGVFGALYPSEMPATDAASRGIVILAADPPRAADAERRIKQLWLSLVDAELAGQPVGPLRRRHRELGAWLSRQAD
jgi:hypothetical protein